MTHKATMVSERWKMDVESLQSLGLPQQLPEAVGTLMTSALQGCPAIRALLDLRECLSAS